MADSRKRRYQGNSSESSNKKRFEGTNPSGFRFLIPSKAAGAMIGKGGEVIKRLRQEHNCRIIVPDSQGPERLVLIDGSPSVVIDIWNDILPSIKEYMNAKDCDYKNASSKHIESDNEIDLRLIVHESQAGAVIGKGGERIRTLIDKHRMTMIKLYQTFCPHSTDRVVRMVSNMENLMQCLENIFEYLENQTIKGERKDYNPNNYDETQAPNYGGFISLDARFPARRSNNFDSDRHPNDNHYDSGDMSRQNAFPRFNNRYEDGVNAVRSMFNQPNPVDRGVTDLLTGVIRLGSLNDMGGIHISRVVVPKNLMHSILGKDSRRLSDLERDSGANIEFEVDRMNPRETIFVVRGSSDQIYKAQCLMQLCARKFSDDGF